MVDRSLAQLIQEHHGTHARLDRLLAALDAQADGPAATQVLDEFRAAMPGHIAAEDEGLFPKLARAFPDRVDLVQQMVGQHREIVAGLDALISAAASPSPELPDQVSRWADLVREHMRVEDEVLFQGAESLEA